MLWQLTTHAVERYIARIAPDLRGDLQRAEQEMRRALGEAKRDREAERLRRGKRGQVLAAEPWATGHPNTRRALTHFVVLPPTDPTTRGRTLVLTCWPSGFAGDEAAELLEAQGAALAGSPPASFVPRGVCLPNGDDWPALVGRIEVARMRAIAYQADLARADLYRDLLVELAEAGGPAEVLIRRRAPELARAADERRRLGVRRSG